MIASALAVANGTQDLHRSTTANPHEARSHPRALDAANALLWGLMRSMEELLQATAYAYNNRRVVRLRFRLDIPLSASTP